MYIFKVTRRGGLSLSMDYFYDLRNILLRPAKAASRLRRVCVYMRYTAFQLAFPTRVYIYMRVGSIMCARERGIYYFAERG